MSTVVGTSASAPAFEAAAHAAEVQRGRLLVAEPASGIARPHMHITGHDGGTATFPPVAAPGGGGG